ncbi:P10 [Melaka orthoreovirus]|uniref:P10 n=2 Tax=unclassified Orthoreovirus TaxID=381638 RepID=A0A291L5D1_9REOV|nr:P10 [Melaka orthoreovirus]ABM67655.1 P10 [Melaka orthoreovirus]ATI13784.1 p10 [Orthoreovirus Lopburi01]ATI13796.1 p10 [Orthoreovirus Lopburi02]
MSGDCAGLVSVFGSVHCQSSKNKAGGDLQATSILTTYWPHLAVGGGIILVIFLLGLFYCCYLKWKTSHIRRTYHKELVALTRGYVRPISADVTSV